MTGSPDFLLLRRAEPGALRAERAAPVAPGPGGEPGRLLERATEGRLGVIPDLYPDRRDLTPAVGQEIGSDLHSPPGQVLHRRLTHQLREPLGQSGPGGSAFPGQRGETPGMVGAPMHDRQNAAHYLVAEAGEPAGLARWQVVEIAAHHLDEHHLRQPGEYTCRTRPAQPGLFGHLPGENAEPGARHSAHMEAAGKRGEQGIEGAPVAPEESADERRAAGTRTAEDDGLGVAAGRAA